MNQIGKQMKMQKLAVPLLATDSTDSSERMGTPKEMSTLGVVMRFRNSAATLPRVLDALAAQTRQPDVIVGLDNASTDESRAILERCGARIINWTQPYHTSRVLNCGLAACTTDLVVVLSSHSVLTETDTFARYEAAFDNPLMAAVSHRFSGVSRYCDEIDLAQVRRHGIGRGSIYSNSVGCLRRRFWEEMPFDERLGFTAEDYDWALTQLEHGRLVKLLTFAHEHNRASVPPEYFLKTSRNVRAVANKHRLALAKWGAGGDFYDPLHAMYWFARCLGRDPEARRNLRNQLDWARGALDWRRYDPFANNPSQKAGAFAS